MVKRGKDLERVFNDNMRGGDGRVEIRHFVDKAEFNGHGRLFSQITLNPGCSIGWHVHEGEEEIFAVMSGNGIFNDNGTEVPVSAGCVTVTRSGEGHAIACTGTQALYLIALIINA